MIRPSSRTTTTITTATRVGLAAVAALVTLAACGDDDEASTATSAAVAVTDAPAATDPPGTAAPGTDTPAAGDATVAVGETELGSVLVDGEGMTLYLFLPDNQGPSTCIDACLAAWPALTGPATAGDGADEALLATAARTDDGSEQVTYNGWPLYTFGNDSAPGDVNGQGLGDAWFAVDAAGAAVPAG